MKLQPERLDPVSGVVLMLQRCHPGCDAAVIEIWTRAEFAAAEAALGDAGCSGAAFVPLRVIHTVEERLRTFPRLQDIAGPTVVAIATSEEPSPDDALEPELDESSEQDEHQD